MGLRRLDRFQRRALITGVIATFGFAVAVVVLRVPPEDWPAEFVPAMVGAAFLCSPYVALAFIAAEALAMVRYTALMMLVGLTALTWWSASTDAQGGLIALYTLPCQWMIAMLTGYSRFRVQGPGRPTAGSPAEREP